MSNQSKKEILDNLIKKLSDEERATLTFAEIAELDQRLELIDNLERYNGKAWELANEIAAISSIYNSLVQINKELLIVFSSEITQQTAIPISELSDEQVKKAVYLLIIQKLLSNFFENLSQANPEGILSPDNIQFSSIGALNVSLQDSRPLIFTRLSSGQIAEGLLNETVVITLEELKNHIQIQGQKLQNLADDFGEDIQRFTLVHDKNIYIEAHKEAIERYITDINSSLQELQLELESIKLAAYSNNSSQ